MTYDDGDEETLSEVEDRDDVRILPDNEVELRGSTRPRAHFLDIVRAMGWN